MSKEWVSPLADVRVYEHLYRKVQTMAREELYHLIQEGRRRQLPIPVVPIEDLSDARLRQVAISCALMSYRQLDREADAAEAQKQSSPRKPSTDKGARSSQKRKPLPADTQQYDRDGIPVARLTRKKDDSPEDLANQSILISIAPSTQSKPKSKSRSTSPTSRKKTRKKTTKSSKPSRNLNPVIMPSSSTKKSNNDSMAGMKAV